MAGPTVDIFCGIVAGIERFPRLSGVQLRAIQISDQAGQCEPEKRRNNREVVQASRVIKDRKSTRLNSSHGYISYAVFCLKKNKKTNSPFDFDISAVRYKAAILFRNSLSAGFIIGDELRYDLLSAARYQ